MAKSSNVSTLYVVNWSGFGFPKLVPNSEGTHDILNVIFGAGLNEIHDEELLDQLLSHPTVEAFIDQGQLKIYDGRVVSLESDLGLQLTDLKGEADGLPVGEIHEGDAKVQYRKSDNVSGTKAKTSKTAYAHGNQPLPKMAS
jgi:hypothetical protein